MRKSIGLLFALALILVGCSKEETEDQIPKMLNVELQIEPKSSGSESIRYLSGLKLLMEMK